MATTLMTYCPYCDQKLQIYVTKMMMHKLLDIKGNKQEIAAWDAQEQADGEVELARVMAKSAHCHFIDTRESLDCPACGESLDIEKLAANKKDWNAILTKRVKEKWGEYAAMVYESYLKMGRGVLCLDMGNISPENGEMVQIERVYIPVQEFLDNIKSGLFCIKPELKPATVQLLQIYDPQKIAPFVYITPDGDYIKFIDDPYLNPIMAYRQANAGLN